MAEIQLLPDHFGKPITNVTDLLQRITEWHIARHINGADAHRRVWYRGHAECKYKLAPGLYRDDFTQAAAKFHGKDLEAKRLNLERELLSEFRVSGATLQDPNPVVSVYFAAQHFGMPTRLLDWTTNPLAALFFSACDAQKKATDGDLIVMDATRLEPHRKDSRQVMTMRHPYATDAIGASFWHDPREQREPLVLPLRPDNQLGRIAQQSSCFTLHMHLAPNTKNPTLVRMRVEASSKEKILDELRRLNINEFTVYNDLDHLSREIRRSRGLL